MLKYTWVLTGNKWQITSTSGLSYQVNDINGMFYLKELLTHPNTEILYSILIARGLYNFTPYQFQDAYQFELIKCGLHEGNWYSEMPKADRKTVYEVGKEIMRLQSRITELNNCGDIGLADELETELEKLSDYFESIATSHKKLKMFYNDTEQLRNCVKQSLWRAYKNMRVSDPGLVLHLMKRIHLYDEVIVMEWSEEIIIEVRNAKYEVRS
jgi:hypothetical protein